MSQTDQSSNSGHDERLVIDNKVTAYTLHSLWLLFGAGVVVCLGMTFYIIRLVMVGRIRLDRPDFYALNLLLSIVFTWLVLRAAMHTRRLKLESSQVNVTKAMRAQSRVWRFMAMVALAYAAFLVGLLIWYSSVMQAFGP